MFNSAFCRNFLQLRNKEIKGLVEIWDLSQGNLDNSSGFCHTNHGSLDHHHLPLTTPDTRWSDDP
jgi:hypothetical protein